jgi:hypothetical protein
MPIIFTHPSLRTDSAVLLSYQIVCHRLICPVDYKMVVAVYEYMHMLVAYMTETGIDRKLSLALQNALAIMFHRLKLQSCTLFTCIVLVSQ